jgi:hypothetical protein
VAKSGHHFPSKAGFTHSSGNVQNVKGYTRSKPVKKAIGGPMGLPGPTSGPKMLPPVRPLPPAGVANPNRVLPSPAGPGGSMAPLIRQAVAARGRPGIRPVGGGALSRFAEGGAVRRMGDGTMTTEEIGDQGNSVVVRREPVTEFDKDYGGKGPLRTGYRKGGKTRKRKADGGPVSDYEASKMAVKEAGLGEGPISDADARVMAAAVAKRAVKKHVQAPAPKGHKGFSKVPLFGKKSIV